MHDSNTALQPIPGFFGGVGLGISGGGRTGLVGGFLGVAGGLFGSKSGGSGVSPVGSDFDAGFPPTYP